MPKLSRRTIVLVATVLLILGSTAFWYIGRLGTESTDNAFVETDIVNISPQVPGTISELLVQEGDHVRKGDPLIRLDLKDFALSRAEAAAQRREVEARIRQLSQSAAEIRSAIEAQRARLASREAELAEAGSNLDRVEELAAKGWVTRKDLDASVAREAQASAQVREARAAVAAEQARLESLGGDRERLLAERSLGDLGVSRQDLAFGRTVIRAPASGYIGPVDISVGEYIEPGRKVLRLVPTARRHVIANFKETQLGEMEIGQKASVVLDAYPGIPLRGRIVSFSPATGSEFAALPIENANGNFVKIVQRVPVRILVEAGPREMRLLRPGLSATVSVKLRD